MRTIVGMRNQVTKLKLSTIYSQNVSEEATYKLRLCFCVSSDPHFIVPQKVVVQVLWFGQPLSSFMVIKLYKLYRYSFIAVKFE